MHSAINFHPFISSVCVSLLNISPSKPFPTSSSSFPPSSFFPLTLHPSLSPCLFLPVAPPPPLLLQLSPSIPNTTYQMEGDSMQLWVLSPRQHLGEKLSPSHMHTDRGRDRHKPESFICRLYNSFKMELRRTACLSDAVQA